jgi:hypothetical protein
MSKQTAVEWLIKEIQRIPLEHRMEKSHLYMHAMKMEIEQIEQAFVDGVDSGSLSDANDYFAKTFKGGQP